MLAIRNMGRLLILLRQSAHLGLNDSIAFSAYDSLVNQPAAIGTTEVKVSQNPRGNCSYCCPMDNPEQYIRLLFTSKHNGTVQLKMRRKQGALHSAGVDSNLPTVFYLAGFMEHGLGPSPKYIRNAYLSRPENYNIITVDWGELTPFPWYPQAVRNSKIVGNVLAKFIRFYSDSGELQISKIHLIGFSLGAHAAGFAGKLLQGAKKIPRITALDPAFPLFPVKDPSQRVSKSDADFVDVIHTDAGKFGFPISVGHADFYPNGGTFVQPGCHPGSLAESRLIEQLGYCGHLRAWRLYAESVRTPNAFPATKCGILHKNLLKNCRFVEDGYMGFSASKSTTQGDFYLTTNGRKPYGKSVQIQQDDMKLINLVL